MSEHHHRGFCQTVVDDGFYIALGDYLYYDVLTDELIFRHPKGSQRIHRRRLTKKRMIPFVDPKPPAP